MHEMYLIWINLNNGPYIGGHRSLLGVSKYAGRRYNVSLTQQFLGCFAYFSMDRGADETR